MRTFLNGLGASMVGFGLALCLAFTSPSAPMRHPTIGTLDMSGGGDGICKYVAGTSGVSLICGSVTGLDYAFGLGTAGSGTGITVNNTGNVRPFVHKVTVTSAAMTAAATTDLTLWTTAVSTRIIRVKADVTTKFIGGALTAVTLKCGSTAAGGEYLLAGDVFTAAIVLGDVVAEMGAGVVSATLADFGTASAGANGAIPIICRFTCTTANCNAATQGTAVIYIEGMVYPP